MPPSACPPPTPRVNLVGDKDQPPQQFALMVLVCAFTELPRPCVSNCRTTHARMMIGIRVPSLLSVCCCRLSPSSLPSSQSCLRAGGLQKNEGQGVGVGVGRTSTSGRRRRTWVRYFETYIGVSPCTSRMAPALAVPASAPALA
jgi:hypothetical protein